MNKKIISIALLIIFHASLFAGGPWAKGKGKSYVKLSEWWTVFDQHFTDVGLLDPNVTTGIYNTSLYLEYGLTENVTSIINGVLFSRNYMNNLKSRTTGENIILGEALNSIGDIDLGVKYSFNQSSKVPLSLSVILGLPTGKTSGGTQGNLQTGDGEFNQIVQLDFGSGLKLGSSNAYLSGYVAVNNRTKGFSEEFRFGLEFGMSFVNNKLWLSTRMNAIESFKNGDTAETVTSTSIFANNTEFLSVGVEANYYITDKLGISVGGATAMRGEIIAAAASFSVGVFADLP